MLSASVWSVSNQVALSAQGHTVSYRHMTTARHCTCSTTGAVLACIQAYYWCAGRVAWSPACHVLLCASVQGLPPSKLWDCQQNIFRQWQHTARHSNCVLS